MKKLIITILIVLIVPAVCLAQSLSDTVLDAALQEIGTGTQWYFTSNDSGGAGDPPDNYTEASSTYALANVAATAWQSGDTCAGGDFYEIGDDATNGGRKIILCGRSGTADAAGDIIETASGTVTFLCVTDATTLLGCLEVNGTTGRTIDHTTEEWTSDPAEFQLRDIQ